MGEVRPPLYTQKITTFNISHSFLCGCFYPTSIASSIHSYTAIKTNHLYSLFCRFKDSIEFVTDSLKPCS